MLIFVKIFKSEIILRDSTYCQRLIKIKRIKYELINKFLKKIFLGKIYPK